MGEPVGRWPFQGFWGFTRKPLFPPGGSGAHSMVKCQEMNSQGAAAAPGQVCRRNISDIFWGTRRGVGGAGRGRQWNGLKITSCERSFFVCFF